MTESVFSEERWLSHLKKIDVFVVIKSLASSWDICFWPILALVKKIEDFLIIDQVLFCCHGLRVDTRQLLCEFPFSLSGLLDMIDCLSWYKVLEGQNYCTFLFPDRDIFLRYFGFDGKKSEIG